MSILKISRLGHPILIKKSLPVKDISGFEVKKIIHDMTETMLDSKGIGLAAPQVFINKQITTLNIKAHSFHYKRKAAHANSTYSNKMYNFSFC